MEAHKPGSYSAEVSAQQEVSGRGTSWAEVGRTQGSKFILAE
jgi:hypothetical protein